MADLIIAAENEDYEELTFIRGPSTVIFELIECDTYMWTTYRDGRHTAVGLQIEELSYDEGDATIEQEQGMLDYAVYELLDPDEMSNGWWVIDGFRCHYHKGDGWMTDDTVDYECDNIRRARWSDMKKFGFGPIPLWVKIVMLVGIDPEVNQCYTLG